MPACFEEKGRSAPDFRERQKMSKSVSLLEKEDCSRLGEPPGTASPETCLFCSMLSTRFFRGLLSVGSYRPGAVISQQLVGWYPHY